MIRLVLLVLVTTQIIENTKQQQQKYKTLHVSLETYAELEQLGTFKDSFEDVIRLLLASHKELQKLKRGPD
jgi:hypothetical protein